MALVSSWMNHFIIQLNDPFQEMHWLGSSSPSLKPSNSEEGTSSGDEDSFSSTSSSAFGIEDPFTEIPGFHNDEDNTELLYESSVTQTLAILFNWFASFPGISKEAFNRLLFILHSYILPVGNVLPANYSSVVKSKVVPIQTYHCCCIIYRKTSLDDFESLQCCGEQRFEPDTKVPRKVFKYIPLLPRLQRIFENKDMSRIIQLHQNLDISDNIEDIHQSSMWKELYGRDGPFSNDPRSISLALCLIPRTKCSTQ